MNPAPGMTQALLRNLAEASATAPFIGPDQAALEATLSAMAA